MSISELKQYGLADMDDTEIHDFLTNQGIGVLGLPTTESPYLLPMSFGFDGDSALYFTYLLGEQSRKEELSKQADSARFLVYDSNSMYDWRSVLLAGTLSEVPEDQWDSIEETLINAWYPELLESAELSRGMAIYRFDIADRIGIKHSGLPPGFRGEAEN
ncbi:MAG: pyridoxamine 5'-phosphate oxidase family protein [Halobacteriales archaeon]|nr:pyridoxamine 5'-phosphate oxidase family protein [Halobacteriales archaeon]